MEPIVRQMLRGLPFAPTYSVDEDGRIWTSSYGRPRPLRPAKHPGGHLLVNLSVGGRSVTMYAHRIVCTVFHGQQPSAKHEVRHLDGNPANNHPTNLAWGTHAENMADLVRHGTHYSKTRPERLARGERHGSRLHPERWARGSASGKARLTEGSVAVIKKRLRAGESMDQIARDHGVSKSCIFGIKKGGWAHVE